MKLRQLRYFVTIVDAGSFSRAAQVAHVAQPALSQQIADLEEQLGITLLQRSARGVSATAAGERLYVEASAILRRIERLPEVVLGQGEEVEGSVYLGMASSLVSLLGGPIMGACRTALPKVRLKFSSAGSLQLAARIREQTLDLAVLFEGEPFAGCVRVPLFERRLFLVRRASGSVRPGSITFQELAGLPLVLPNPPNITRVVLDRLFVQAGFEPHITAETDLSTGMLAAVQAGVGDGILPLGGTDELPGIFFAQAIEPAVSLTAGIVSSAETPLAAAGEAVRDFIAGFVKKYLADHPVSGVESAAE
ncbi:LysR substrate-binding domain-containing protein [Paraburkholderia sediminicola]|uniref:LysR substrate-binding domain-containing protein n=1 Tax=Paraburkholderia sediminicola TaxID=458836 RepID=UPI0038BB9B07